jgi:hypothetical protein
LSQLNRLSGTTWIGRFFSNAGLVKILTDSDALRDARAFAKVTSYGREKDRGLDNIALISLDIEHEVENKDVIGAALMALLLSMVITPNAI